MEIWLKPRKPGPLWRFLSSVWLAVGLISWVGVICVIGTFADLKEAEVVFFRTRWFGVMIGALMLNIFVATLNRASKPLVHPEKGLSFPWRLSQIPFLLVHLGLLLTFTAMIITRLFLVDGQVLVADQPSNSPGFPAHRTNVLQRKDRRIDLRLLLDKDAPAEILTAAGRVTALTADGQTVTGQVISHFGSGPDASLVLKTANGQQPLKRSDLQDIIAEDREPIYLSYLPETKDLQASTPGAFWVGLVTSLIFAALAFFLGKSLNSGMAPLITAFVMACLALPLFWELPNHRVKFFNGAVTATYKSYIPHAQERSVVEEASAGSSQGASNPALLLSLGGRRVYIFKKPQENEVRIDGEEPLVTPISYGPELQINFIELASKSLRDQAIRDGRSELPSGQITIGLAGDSKSQQVLKDDLRELVGRSFDFGEGRKITVTQLVRDFRVRPRQSEGGAGPHDAADRWEIFDTQDLANPALVYRVNDETRDRVVFAWYPELNGMLGGDRGAPEWLAMDYFKARPLSPRGLTFIRYLDGSTPEAVTHAPGEEHKVQSLELFKPINVSVGDHEESLELIKIFGRAEIRDELVNVTAADHTRWKDFNDAVLVELNDGKNRAEGWLRYGVPLNLKLGATEVRLIYNSQIEIFPFEIQLDHFEIEHHPGSMQPSEFRSTVTVFDKTDNNLAKQFQAQVYMNHTLDHMGYRFFQSSYMLPPNGPKISVFSVAKDPGTPLWYAGCIILCFGVLVIFFVKPSLIEIEKRQALQAANAASKSSAPVKDLKDPVPAS